MLYEIKYDASMKISLAKGNSKLGKGVYAFNTLPGDKPLSTKDKGQLTNVYGTCGGCCDGCEKFCYAVNDARRFHNTCIPSLGKNTVIMRNDLEDGFNQIKQEIAAKKVKVLRWHSSGEIMSYDYLLKMVDVAREFPDVKCYVYTKRFAWVEQYLKENGMFPDNFICNISQWNDNTKGYNLEGLNRFVYDDGSDESITKMMHCPAVKKDGTRTSVTCDKCKRCFSGNKGLVTAVYDH